MLDEIVEKTKERVETSKEIIPLEDLKKEVSLMEINDEFPFKKALSGDDISIIAEVKKASPSKGLIAEDFDYLKIARDYEEAGASAISVLTEPYFFMGSDEYLSEIAENVSIPVLRKDFVVFLLFRLLFLLFHFLFFLVYYLKDFYFYLQQN